MVAMEMKKDYCRRIKVTFHVLLGRVMRGYSGIGVIRVTTTPTFFLENQFSLNIEDSDPKPRPNERQMPKVYGDIEKLARKIIR